MTWTPPSRRGLPWLRFGLAGGLVVVCAMAGVTARCDEMPGTDFIALALLLIVQGATGLGSFATSGHACVKRDWQRARREAFVGMAMLSTIPLAGLAMFWLAPSCEC